MTSNEPCVTCSRTDCPCTHPRDAWGAHGQTNAGLEGMNAVVWLPCPAPSSDLDAAREWPFVERLCATCGHVGAAHHEGVCYSCDEHEHEFTPTPSAIALKADLDAALERERVLREALAASEERERVLAVALKNVVASSSSMPRPAQT